MEKLTNFFKSKLLQSIAWSFLIICAIVLIIGGVSIDSLTKSLVLVGAIVSAVIALISFLISKIKN